MGGPDLDLGLAVRELLPLLFPANWIEGRLPSWPEGSAKASLGRKRGVFASVPFGVTPADSGGVTMPEADAFRVDVDEGDGDCAMTRVEEYRQKGSSARSVRVLMDLLVCRDQEGVKLWETSSMSPITSHRV